MIRMGFFGGLVFALAFFWWRSPAHRFERETSESPRVASLTPTPKPSARPIVVSPPVARAEPGLRAIDVPREPAREVRVGPFSPSNEWPGWYCADFEGDERKSAWKHGENAEVISEIQEGTCAEWANRGPGAIPFPQDTFDSHPEQTFDPVETFDFIAT